MSYSQNGAARYRTLNAEGLVAEASPAKLVQIAFDNVLAHLAVAQGCMRRIENNLPLADVIAKGHAISKAVLLIGHLNERLDLERGGEVAANLRLLYSYMLERLTAANASNDADLVVEIAGLVREIKSGWDRLVAEGR
ncbi:MAG: flagellar export chaperone FliS [Gammaproteobacteria bacterium]|nr:flagellar export chaperone FliS [Gammaproteobacteria bacterium]